MTDPGDINRRIIDEFRASGGTVKGPAEGFSLLLLHSRGARTGADRINPVAYQPLADGWAVFATYAGGPRHPAWYHNLVAHPETIIEVGCETVPVRARVAVGEERDTIWARQKAFYPRFARYERQTTREIPVVVLERMSARRPGSSALPVT